MPLSFNEYLKQSRLAHFDPWEDAFDDFIERARGARHKTADLIAQIAREYDLRPRDFMNFVRKKLGFGKHQEIVLEQEYLYERIELLDWQSKPYEVYKRPSLLLVNRLMRKIKELRWMVLKDGEMYLWDSDRDAHEDVIRKLGYSEQEYVSQGYIIRGGGGKTFVELSEYAREASLGVLRRVYQKWYELLTELDPSIVARATESLKEMSVERLASNAGEMYRVWGNPTASQLKSLLPRQKHLRWMTTKDGKIFFWPALQDIHKSTAEKLGYRWNEVELRGDINKSRGVQIWGFAWGQDSIDYIKQRDQKWGEFFAKLESNEYRSFKDYLSEADQKLDTQLDEFLKSPYSWKKLRGITGPSFQFKTSDGREVSLDIDEFDKKTTDHISFHVDGEMGKTGQGDEIRIFSTIVAILRDRYENMEVLPRVVEFSANKFGDSRGRLYTRFANKLSQELAKLGSKYKLKVSEDDLGAYFRLEQV